MNKNLLSQGQHLGIHWRVLHNGLGHRCGYAQVPAGHPWFQQHYNSIPAEIHGGLTYSEDEDGEWWIGFDCAHAQDLPDPLLQDRLDPQNQELFPLFARSMLPDAQVRSQEYVEEQCKSLCQQIFDTLSPGS